MNSRFMMLITCCCLLMMMWWCSMCCSRRDMAHKKVKQLFYEAIKARKESGSGEDDMLQTLIDTTYKWDMALISMCRPVFSQYYTWIIGSSVVRGSRGVMALYHCFLDKITVIPLFSTVFSVILLHKMEFLTFYCLTKCIKSFQLTLCLTELLNLKKNSAERGDRKVKNGSISGWVYKKKE